MTKFVRMWYIYVYKMKLFVLVVTILTITGDVMAQTAADAKALRKKLFVTDQYDKKVRSMNDQSEPTVVFVSFHLLAINELDEVRETLKTSGYLEVQWKDEFLTWNTADYGGMSYTFFPQDDVWKPDVALKNSVVEYKELGVSTLNINVGSTGDIIWLPFQMFQSSCNVDIKYFPFDIQTCQLKFVAWSYSKNEVDMRAGVNGIAVDQYEQNSEWNIIDTQSSVEQESGEASIIFTMKIQRKPRYLFIAIIFPLFTLTILNLFVFVLPSNGGEKASYAITVFLAFAVFLTIVTGSLPENSDSVAVFSIYVVSQTCQSTIITVIAVILIRLHKLGSSRPVPGYLISFVKFVTCKKCQTRSSVIEPERHKINGTVPRETDNINSSTASIPTKEGDDTDGTKQDDIYDWRRVVDTLDWFFLVFFSIVAFISTLLCLVLASALAKTV